MHPSSKWRKQERPVAKGLWGPRGARAGMGLKAVKEESCPGLSVSQGSPVFVGGASCAGLTVADPPASTPRSLAAQDSLTCVRRMTSCSHITGQQQLDFQGWAGMADISPLPTLRCRPLCFKLLLLGSDVPTGMATVNWEKEHLWSWSWYPPTSQGPQISLCSHVSLGGTHHNGFCWHFWTLNNKQYLEVILQGIVCWRSLPHSGVSSYLLS